MKWEMTDNYTCQVYPNVDSGLVRTFYYKVADSVLWANGMLEPAYTS